MKTLTGPKVIALQSPPNYTREMSSLDAHMPMSAWGTHVQTCTAQNDTWEHVKSSGYIKTNMKTSSWATSYQTIHLTPAMAVAPSSSVCKSMNEKQHAKGKCRVDKPDGAVTPLLAKCRGSHICMTNKQQGY
jgi:hypothetical protein